MYWFYHHATMGRMRPVSKGRPIFRPLRPQRISDAIVARIKEMIYEGTLRPGALMGRLPNAVVRPPLAPSPEAEVQKIRAALRDAKLA